ncbi:hypothetical protein [Stenotrophomonas sp.]|uniref:hypothetical protein n=1 Tax=Stenotrophomonas sp. TaxID=69392 RepID=UPI0028A03C43|nr:hypothetical protein [Stenotrophomonas sp.]
MLRTKVPWSLKGEVRRDVEGWTRFNARRRKLRFPPLYRDVIYYTEHPIRLCASLVALATLATAAAILWMDVLSIAASEPWTDASEGSSHFTTLLAIQATIAALVYPIVIAFVTLFLQRRPATQALLQLYIVDTGALVAGLSALTLVVAMSCEYVTLASLSPRTLIALTGVNAIWFCCNAALTTYFLFRTIDFLRPQAQRLAIHRYVANAALPREVERAHLLNLFHGIAEKSWIPLPSASREPSPDGPQIILGGWFSRNSASNYSIHLRSPSTLSNIRLWPLHEALRSWKSKASLVRRCEDAHPFNEGWPTIELPVKVQESREGNVDLVKVSNGPDLTRLQRALFSYSFIFSKTAQPRYRVTTLDILDELKADLLTAISNRDFTAFERSYEELTQAHKLLVDSSVCELEAGRPVSCAMLHTTERTLFGESLHESWIRTYRPIIDAAAGAVSVDAKFFQRMCQFSLRIHGDGLKNSPIAMRAHLLSVPSALIYELGTWWAMQAEDCGQVALGPHSTASLNGSMKRLYQSAVQSFVEGWESALELLVDFPEADKFDWSRASEQAELSSDHATSTARFLLAAVYRGDVEAAEWFADVLSKWIHSFHFRHDPVYLYGKTSFVTIDYLKQPWSDARQQIGISDNDFTFERLPEGKLQHAVATAALRNYWTDLKLLVIEILLYWSIKTPPADAKGSLAMQVATGLLSNASWRPGGDYIDHESRMTPARYIRSKLRQYGSDVGRSQHRGKLEQFIERIQDFERPTMISGRTYMMSSSDLGSLQDATLALLIALSDQAWTVDEITLRETSAWLTNRRQDFDRAETLTTELIRELRANKPEVHGVARALSYATVPQIDPEKRSALAITSMEKFGSELRNTRSDALDLARIDPARLHQLAEYASTTAFAAREGEFPLQLFNEIAYQPEELTKYTLTMSKVRKGELTQANLQTRAINERQFWQQTMANYVGAVVLNDVLQAADVEDRQTPDALSYWDLVRAEAARMRNRGRQPLLILDNATRPDWVWDWQQSVWSLNENLPEGLRVTKHPGGRGDGYVCDFNDIHVFSGPLPAGQSILTSQNLFEKVTFQQHQDGSHVRATAMPSVESKHLMDVGLSFSRSVTIGKSTAFRLRYSEKTD